MLFHPRGVRRARCRRRVLCARRRLLDLPSPRPATAGAWRAVCVLARAADKRRLGPTRPPQVDFRVYLRNRGGDAAQQLATAVSTRGTRSTASSSPPRSTARTFFPGPVGRRRRRGMAEGPGFRVGYVPTTRSTSRPWIASPGVPAFGTSFSDYTVQGQRCGRTTRRWRCRARCRRSRPWSGLDESAALVEHDATLPAASGAGPDSPVRPTRAERRSATPPSRVSRSRPRSPPSRRVGMRARSRRGPTGWLGAIADGNDGSGSRWRHRRVRLSDGGEGSVDLLRGARLSTPKLTERVAPGIYDHATTRSGTRRAGPGRAAAISRPCTPWPRRQHRSTSGAEQRPVSRRRSRRGRRHAPCGHRDQLVRLGR